MASETVASLGPLDFQRETDLGNDYSVVLVQGPGESSQGSAPAADIRGLSLPKYLRGNLVAYGYTATFRIPGNLTMGTGLTFKFYLTDDGQSAADLGSNVKLGLTVKRLAADATDDIDVSAAAEQSVAVTLSANSSGIAVGTLAIANASLPSGIAVGDLVMIRVRRIGTDGTNDTALGRAILLRAEIYNS